MSSPLDLNPLRPSSWMWLDIAGAESRSVPRTIGAKEKEDGVCIAFEPKGREIDLA